jgi:TonB family protein
MLARVQGKVELRLGVDRETGEIQRVEVISGNPMLQSSAADAAKKWRLVPGTVSEDTVSAVVDYSLECP